MTDPTPNPPIGQPEPEAAAEPEPTFAVVELFGHAKIAGKISEVTLAGAQFLRVDVPGILHIPPFCRYYNPAAVYGITPTDEAQATATAARLRLAPPGVDPYAAKLIPPSIWPADEEPNTQTHDDETETDLF